MATDKVIDVECGEDKVQGFLGFVLLREARWDKAEYLERLKANWGIDLLSLENKPEDNKQEDTIDSDKEQDIIFAEYEGMRLAVSLFEFPVPNGEAEHYASANYMWEEAVETVKQHQAQLMVTALGDEVDARHRGMLYSALVANALADDNALAVYSDGAVYAPDFYQEVTQVAWEEQDLPLLAWVWFGYGQNEAGQPGFYTYGLSKFGKDEMEIYSEQPLDEIRGMLYNIAYYVVASDVVLNDGETIGLSEEQKLSITRSKGICLGGETLKIAF